MLLTGGIAQKIGEIRNIDNTAPTPFPHILGDRVEVSLDGHHAAFIYAKVGGTPATAVTDIMTWVSMALRTVVNTVASVQNFAAGLYTGSTLAIATDGIWLQYAGEKLTYADGTTMSNNLLGDGSVANGEDIMAHAATAGMVDTYAGALIEPIGKAFEDDAPAISKYYLHCLCSMM